MRALMMHDFEGPPAVETAPDPPPEPDGVVVAAHGCGGVRLAAVMIASPAGVGVVAVDIDPAKLALAHSLGADHAVLEEPVKAIAVVVP